MEETYEGLYKKKTQIFLDKEQIEIRVLSTE